MHLSRKRAQLRTVLNVLLLSALACGSLGQNEQPSLEPTSPPSIPTNTEFPPTEEPENSPPEPLNLVGMVAQGVEEGQWSEGEGLTAALQFMVGETELPGFVEAPAGIDYHSGWALSNQAALYLESGADEESKAEIDRLLGILAPPDENLAHFAVPAGTSQGKAPGLAAPANWDVACLDLWFIGFRDTIVDPPVCLEYAESVTYNGTHRARAYYPIEKASDPAVMAAVRESLEAVEETIRIYRNLDLEVKSINIIFTQLDIDALTYAQVPSTRTNEEINLNPCPLLVFPLGVAMENREHFKQTIAHEVFHCVQFWRYGAFDTGNTLWWAEGGAVYASDLVYPAANIEFTYIDSFDENAQTDRLTQMDYEAFMFFMYLAGRQGNYNTIRIIDKFTNKYGGAETESSERRQLEALVGIDGIQDLFHDFGKAYLDRRILDFGNDLIPVSPQLGEILEYPSTSVNPDTIPFVLTNYLIIFEEDQEYTINMSTTGPPGRSSARPSEEGDAWGRMPEEVRSSCGVSQFKLLMTSTDVDTVGTDDLHTLELDVNVEESPYECDECLVGHWVMSVDRVIPYASSMINSQPGVRFMSLSGVFHLDFTPEGQMGLSLENYKLHWIKQDEGFEIDVVQEFLGVSWAKYGATEDDRLRAWDENSAILVNSTISAQGITTTTS
ncbi:hypothetical protein ACFLYP_02240, partial [Chloroflexota bacterium]